MFYIKLLMMENNCLIDLETFDFDFWTNNKVRVLQIVYEQGGVSDIRTLSMLADISYATTYDIFSQLAAGGYLRREGRRVILEDNWAERFRKGVCIASDDT